MQSWNWDSSVSQVTGVGGGGISDPAQVGLLQQVTASDDAQQVTIPMPFDVKGVPCAGKGSAQPSLARALQQVDSSAVDVPAMAARIVDTRIEENFMVIEIN